MAQSSLWAPAIVFVLWLVVAMKYRALFAPIFVPVPVLPEGGRSASRPSLPTRNVGARA